MNRHVALWVVGILCIGTPALASADIELLLSELGGNASRALQNDLALPDLLPADGIHRGHPIWHVGEREAPEGSMAVVYPTAVRVGLELEKLRAQGVEFTDTPTVLRILRATDQWNQLIQRRPWRAAIARLDRAVRDRAVAHGARPDQLLVDAVLGAHLDLASRLSVSEAPGAGTTAPAIDLEPKPGELWCYRVLFGQWTGEDHYECTAGGDNCWVQIPCPRRPE